MSAFLMLLMGKLRPEHVKPVVHSGGVATGFLLNGLAFCLHAVLVSFRNQNQGCLEYRLNRPTEMLFN